MAEWEKDPIASDWQSDPVVDDAPTINQMVGAFGSAATGGMLREGAAVAGAAAGGVGGMALGGPWGAAAGIPTGYFSGRMAGNEIDRYLTQNKILGRQWSVKDPQKLPEGLRVAGEMGRVVGETVPYMALPAVAAARGGKALVGKALTSPKVRMERSLRGALDAIGRVPGNVVKTATLSPGAHAAAEAGGTTGAALGAGVAEAIAPGETGPRVAGEVIGGFASPARILAKLSGGTVAAARNLRRSMTRAGREEAAGETIKSFLKEVGEDPDEIARRLLEEDSLELDKLPADAARSPALLGLERGFMKPGSIEAEAQLQRRSKTLNRIMSLLNDMSRDASPELLKTIAETRRAYFSTILSSRVNRALGAADEAVGRIGGADVTENLSTQSQAALRRVLERSRDEEARLWRQVPGELEGSHEGVLGAYDDIRQRILPDESLPSPIEPHVRRFREPNPADFDDPDAYQAALDDYEPPTVANIRRFRTRMLELARESAAKNEFGNARMYGELAEGALEDLEAIDTLEPALQSARDFSRSFHDTFSRTIAGQALSRTRTGARRIPPEVILDEIFAGKRGALNFRQMREAAAFMPGPEAEQIRSSQEEFLRSTARKLINPNTGRVNPDQLAKFRRDNANVLQSFPRVDRDLQNVVSAENALNQTQAMSARAEQQARRYAEFSKVIGVDNPVDRAARLIRSQDIKGYGQFAKLAKRGGPEHMNAAKSATLDAAIETSSVNGNVNFDKLSKSLLEGRRGKSSIFEAMRMQGLVNQRDGEAIKLLVKEGQRAQRITKQGLVYEGADTADGLYDLIVRITGANIGGHGAIGQSTGTPLVAAHAGSKFARNLFETVPQTKVGDVIKEALANRQFMAELLKKAKTPEEKLRIASTINGFLVQAGITTPQE